MIKNPAPKLYVLVIIFVLMVNSGQLYGNKMTREIIKSTEWLSSHIEDSSLILLHVDFPENFEKGHIPGASLVPFRKLITLRQPDVLSDEFPSHTKLDSVFESLGIGDNSTIVVYYGDETVYDLYIGRGNG